MTTPDAPSILVVKTATVTSVSNAGDTITYGYTVTNTGNVTLTSVLVTDDMATVDNGGAISDDANDGAGTLEPGAMENATGSYTLTQADINAGSKTNVADADVNDPDGNNVNDEDTVMRPSFNVSRFYDKIFYHKGGPNYKKTNTD